MQFNDPCLMTSFSRPDAGDVPHTNHRNPTVVNFLPVTFFMEICRTVDYPDRLDELADLLTEGFFCTSMSVQDSRRMLSLLPFLIYLFMALSGLWRGQGRAAPRPDAFQQVSHPSHGLTVNILVGQGGQSARSHRTWSGSPSSNSTPDDTGLVQGLSWADV